MYNLLQMLGITFSRRLAILGGLALPVLETVRRWREIPGPIESWPYWMDDWLFGVMLLAAAWVSRPGKAFTSSTAHAPPTAWLTAAWGFVCGAGFSSTMSTLRYALHPELGDDPSGLPHVWIFVSKAMLTAIGVLGLVTSMHSDDAKAITR